LPPGLTEEEVLPAVLQPLWLLGLLPLFWRGPKLRNGDVGLAAAGLVALSAGSLMMQSSGWATRAEMLGFRPSREPSRFFRSRS